MANVQQTVGVIGGLGPDATLDFFAKLLRATPAERDQDHLHVIIDNNPKVPNRHASIAGTGPSCVPALTESARALERAGADFLVMPCNTAHVYESDIRAATALPLLSIVDASLDACRAFAPHRVGLLAADGCLLSGLYQKRLEAEGLSPLCPDDDTQARLMALIFAIKAGDTGKEVREGVRALAEGLLEDGADLVLAACTEVPLVLGNDLERPLVSSTDALVAATLRYATA